MTFSGRLVWEAMRPIGMDEVLLARITPGLQISSISFEDFEFEGFVFRGRLHDEIGIRHIFQIGGDLDTAQDGILFFRGELALIHIFAENLGYVGQPLFGKLNFDITHDHVEACGSRYLGNTVSHLTGTDHAVSVDCHCFPSSFAKSLFSFYLRRKLLGCDESSQRMPMF